MSVTYGIEVAEEEDHYITVAETALEGMAKAAHPGAFLVDIFPIRELLQLLAGGGCCSALVSLP